MISLVGRYGYYSKGETFSIGDPNEVWIMDLIGKGPDEKGAVWVARRVPDGGISWFGVDDTYSTVDFPAYAGITEAPYAFRVGTGSYHEVDYDAAFWSFNRVANFAYSRYSDMIVGIQRVQQELEGRYLGDVPEVDAAAAALFEKSPRLARDYLTRYSTEAGNALVSRWNRLFDELLSKYLDDNGKDEFGQPEFEGYPEEWYRTIVATTASTTEELIGGREE
jgi:dipeptidase